MTVRSNLYSKFIILLVIGVAVLGGGVYFSGNYVGKSGQAPKVSSGSGVVKSQSKSLTPLSKPASALIQSPAQPASPTQSTTTTLKPQVPPGSTVVIPVPTNKVRAGDVIGYTVLDFCYKDVASILRFSVDKPTAGNSNYVDPMPIIVSGEIKPPLANYSVFSYGPVVFDFKKKNAPGWDPYVYLTGPAGVPVYAAIDGIKTVADVKVRCDSNPATIKYLGIKSENGLVYTTYANIEPK